MNGTQAVEYIHSLRHRGKKSGLDKMRRLLQFLGNPQDRLKFIHVIGTNGKGSTSTMTANILTDCGYKTGLFISPFILDFRERMQIDGQMIAPEELAACVQEVKPFADQMEAAGECPTEFEMVTAAALVFFARQQCDIVVLEAGIGGRLDCTNVIETAVAAVICAIGLDHVQILGNTVEEIARDKCGILRDGLPCVCYPKQDTAALGVILEECARHGSRLIQANPAAAQIHSQTLAGTQLSYRGMQLSLPLVGPHQVCNCQMCIRDRV